MLYEGEVTRKVTGSAKVAFSSIQLKHEEKPIELVLFKMYDSAVYVPMFEKLEIGDTIRVEGREGRNPQNNEKQIIIKEITLADKERVDVQVRQEEVDTYTCPDRF